MLAGVVLAAGKGTRFKSKKPKVLQLILDKPMVWYVCKALEKVVNSLFMVVGYGKDMVCDEFEGMVDVFVSQDEQLGTGHAVMCAIPDLLSSKIEYCLVANGDMPLVTDKIFKNFVDFCLAQRVDVGIVTTELDNPFGYGRVWRDEKGLVKKIVEEKDIKDSSIRDIKEINAGIYFLNIEKVKDLFKKLSNENAQKEYYLTDLVEVAYQEGLKVLATVVDDGTCVLGANNPKELILCEKLLQNRINDKLLDRGVILRNPELVRVGPEVEIEPGVELLGPLEVYGRSKIKEDTLVESNVFIKDCEIGKGCIIKSFSYLEGAVISDFCTIGPFSRIRPDTFLDENVKIGNFVEVKKSRLEKGVKANHLAYLGDATVGEGTNIGAGTITCNYDGEKKHPTFIGKGAFIGSNTSLVAPVKIGDYSVVGAGSTITKDVPEKMLAVARAKQKVVKYRKIKIKE